MSESGEVALITFVVGPAVLALMTWFLTGRKIARIDRNSRVTRAQVVNDHGDTNLRDEQDDRHKENHYLLTRLVKTTEHQATAMGGMRDTLRTLADSDNLHARRALLVDERIDRLESTARKHGHTPIGLLP